MKIQLLSDLHLEANPDFVPQPAPGADVLVLAGDIGSYQKRKDGSRMHEPDWGLRRFAPLASGGPWPQQPVLFVPGNHEYDRQDFDHAHRSLRATCERLGLIWLERESVVIAGVRFIGTTLWSDFEALATPPIKQRNTAGPSLPPLAYSLQQRDKAFRAANFYLNKAATTRQQRLFDAAAMREHALHCQHWLRQALLQPFDGPTVVVTHFAPSLRSADPRYGLTPGTAGFCNALDDLLPHADLWLHGHVHCAHDYRVGRCRVVANPLGYESKHEQVGFLPQHCLSVA